MSVDERASAHQTGAGTRAAGGVLEALGGFQGVHNSPMRWLLGVLPWFTLLLVAAELAGLVRISDRQPGDPMYISGLLAAALAILALQRLMPLIPETFGTLWSRGLVSARSSAVPLEQQYRGFVYAMQELLNSRAQWVLAVVFALLGVSWRFLVSLYEPEMGLEFLLGFAIGFVAWRVLVAGRPIAWLQRDFELTPQFGHPDRCGGFKPLGRLYLWNALIATIPSLFLGGWIMFGPLTGYGNTYTPLFSGLILVPILWAMLSFFWPLWSVHRVMVARRAVVLRQLDQLAQSIDDLGRELLSGAVQLDPQEGEQKVRRLELMRQIYLQNQDLPVWPFNVSILARFASSQAVPLLGLTGLGGPVIDVVTTALDVLSQGR